MTIPPTCQQQLSPPASLRTPQFLTSYSYTMVISTLEISPFPAIRDWMFRRHRKIGADARA
ncbi:hypothetical protein N7455_012353 [Penicillium solitum]|uniref:uncharacterized protein n=1 Tax=Penicillium solitum TaxID=60172 RepID=UPI0032C48C2D|nr:hypothetical protein N7455_012353 [Penicillium solitum]